MQGRSDGHHRKGAEVHGGGGVLEGVRRDKAGRIGQVAPRQGDEREDEADDRAVDKEPAEVLGVEQHPEGELVQEDEADQAGQPDQG